MKYLIYFSIFATIATQVFTFGNNDERFLKKYAMMKIYESCFGEDVVRQIRQELKRACAKCATSEPVPILPEEKPQNSNFPPQNSNFPPQSIEQEKIHQAILAFRPNPVQQQTQFKPQVGYQGMAPPANFYGSPFGSPIQPFYYPGFPQMPFSPYNFPIVGQQFYGNRMSRNMDIRNQLELLTTKMNGKVRNITCVMQELGYLDDNLEPNYIRINERIGNLPVSEELRKDMQDGVAFCQQFSQCVPEIKKDRSPLSRELVRPMFFFKCYKHKKLEACIMKDVREKFSGVADEEFDSELDFRRAGKDMKITENDENVENLASSLYEFLYASDSNMDLDLI